MFWENGSVREDLVIWKCFLEKKIRDYIVLGDLNDGKFSYGLSKISTAGQCV